MYVEYLLFPRLNAYRPPDIGNGGFEPLQQQVPQGQPAPNYNYGATNY